MATESGPMAAIRRSRRLAYSAMVKGGEIKARFPRMPSCGEVESTMRIRLEPAKPILVSASVWLGTRQWRRQVASLQGGWTRSVQDLAASSPPRRRSAGRVSEWTPKGWFRNRSELILRVLCIGKQINDRSPEFRHSLEAGAMSLENLLFEMKMALRSLLGDVRGRVSPGRCRTLGWAPDPALQESRGRECRASGAQQSAEAGSRLALVSTG